MIEQVEHNGQPLALIVSSRYKSESINFLTPDDYSLQLAYMTRPKGYDIQPHVHRQLDRHTTLTQEVLFIRKGKLRVDFYDENQEYLTSRNLDEGDVILLATGGHGFHAIEEVEIIEVKQGPFSKDLDKIRFHAKPGQNLNFG